MISQIHQNHSEHFFAFEILLQQIEASDWKSNLQKCLKKYNIECFNLEKLTPKKAKQLYQRINQKFYMYQQSKNGLWVENQLKLFIWMLVLSLQINNTSTASEDNYEWKNISKIFKGKSVQTCKFQYKLITNAKATSWNQEQQFLLINLLKKYQGLNPNWNQISRDIFNISLEKYFKTSKQCRQHWNNYLNPNVIKNKWNRKQDYILMKHVVQKGKQWATISKILQSRRTQHMVKNRYKSIILSYNKQFGIPNKQTQNICILQNILNKIKSELQQLQQSGQKKEQPLNIFNQKYNIIDNKTTQQQIQAYNLKNEFVSFINPTILFQPQQPLTFQLAFPQLVPCFHLPIKNIIRPPIFLMQSINIIPQRLE